MASIIALILLIFFFFNISLGAVSIPLKEIFKTIIGNVTEKNTWEYIILHYRLPKAITTTLVGVGLSISGLFMQTLFRNPLAGPDVLGLSSGASLGVAFIILGTPLFPSYLVPLLTSSFGMILAAGIGCCLVLLGIIVISQRLRDTTAILIIGIMFGSFANAIIGILSYLNSAETLQKFTFWSLGNLGNLSWTSVIILTISCLIGVLIGIYSIKPLNSLLLGENYAKSLGLNIKKTKFILILATSILTGSITAFVGPIGFIGLTVPHITKLIFKTSNHTILFWNTITLGAIMMLCCDTLSQVIKTNLIIPINAITSLIGAPIVIWLLIKKHH